LRPGWVVEGRRGPSSRRHRAVAGRPSTRRCRAEPASRIRRRHIPPTSSPARAVPNLQDGPEESPAGRWVSERGFEPRRAMRPLGPQGTNAVRVDPLGWVSRWRVGEPIPGHAQPSGLAPWGSSESGRNHPVPSIRSSSAIRGRRTRSSGSSSMSISVSASHRDSGRSWSRIRAARSSGLRFQDVQQILSRPLPSI
jgi:hypothetical protein